MKDKSKNIARLVLSNIHIERREAHRTADQSAFIGTQRFEFSGAGGVRWNDRLEIFM